MSACQLLLNWGEVHVPAGTASLLVSVAPVFGALLAAAFLGERLTAAKRAAAGDAVHGVPRRVPVGGRVRRLGYAVARHPLTVATAALHLVPAVALAVAFGRLGERPTWVDLVGGALSVAGVVLIGATVRRWAGRGNSRKIASGAQRSERLARR
ncbi:DMT family transporter [Amycolatopsis sp. H6(2020)]|nr:DMT family transporter [Amycolatopsis sp. H6(2020)]